MMSNVSDRKIIAISRQQGSGGSYIGRAVAERLGLRYFDRDMLRTAAEFLCQQDAAPQSDDSWLERLSSCLALASLDSGYVPPSQAVLYEGELIDIEERLIREIVAGHSAVVVGRGAAQTLRGTAGVVTVFVHAPEPWRVARVQQVYRTADHAQAARMVRQSDQERARFIRRISDVDWTNACGYDLALNSMTLGLEGAVDLIVRSSTARIVEAVGA